MYIHINNSTLLHWELWNFGVFHTVFQNLTHNVHWFRRFIDLQYCWLTCFLVSARALLANYKGKIWNIHFWQHCSASIKIIEVNVLTDKQIESQIFDTVYRFMCFLLMKFDYSILLGLKWNNLIKFNIDYLNLIENIYLREINFTFSKQKVNMVYVSLYGSLCLVSSFLDYKKTISDIFNNSKIF